MGPADRIFLEAEASGEQTEEEKPKVEDPEGLSRSKTTLKHLPCLLEFIDGYIAEKVTHVNSARCEKAALGNYILVATNMNSDNANGSNKMRSFERSNSNRQQIIALKSHLMIH